MKERIALWFAQPSNHIKIICAGMVVCGDQMSRIWSGKMNATAVVMIVISLLVTAYSMDEVEKHLPHFSRG